jgi:aryl-alcohol dehydrogenase-like predicted oxidoreductase
MQHHLDKYKIDHKERKPTMQKRTLGKTGEQLSIIGFGGIVVTGVEPAEAERAVREAFDRGINYFDVAPSYGNAEERLGPALVGLREQVFLACKTGERTKAGAARELRESLRRLKTDHFDLYQLHAMTTPADLETAMGAGGAIEAFIEAREQGLARYLGFSAHSVETALALIDRFDFDTILFPINWVNYFQANFGPQVIEKARGKGMGQAGPARRRS